MGSAHAFRFVSAWKLIVNPKIIELIEPVVTAHGLDLFDVDQNGPNLVVTVDREGGVDLDAIATVTRALSRALDDADPIAGRYTLEVSSPGLERKLRKPNHYVWAIGREVSIKAVASFEGDRRVRGVVASADDDGITVSTDSDETIALRYDDIDTARTIFEWGPAPKPGSRPSSDKRRVEAK